MANTAYRAVFLRVHPTGKCVLSLSTTSQGNEQQLAQIVSNELGIPREDTDVVAQDFDRFGEGHGWLESPSAGTDRAVAMTARKIRDKMQLLAGAVLGTAPTNLTWDNGRFYVGRDPSNGASFEEVAFRAFGGGDLPVGVEGGLDAQTAYMD